MAKDIFSFQDMMGELVSSLNNSLSRPSVKQYIPHQKQLKFHQSKKVGRLYIGGNRSGKTVGGIVEDVWWLTGTHPYIETPPPPIRGRIVTVDFENGWELIIKPELQRWLPATELVNGSWQDSWSEKYKVLTLANGSRLDIMSYSQATEKQAGTSRHFIHFDEEPPSVLFDENMMRLMDTEGSWWITMTPVEGATWTMDRLYEKGLDGKHPHIDVITVNTRDNPYISDDAPNIYTEGMSEESRKAREEGEFVHHGGLIYKSFDYNFHVRDEFIPPLDWQWIRSCDHGYNNPTAWLYHAVAPDGTIFTFYEHYQSHWTVAEHAKRLHEIDSQPGFKKPERTVGDPAIKQRTAETGKSVHRLYLDNGIAIQTSNNDVKAGIDQGNNYIRSGKWFVTRNCRKFIWEMKRYRWKTRNNRKLQEMHGNYDEPHKKDDHAMDSWRYTLINYPIPKRIDDLTAEQKRMVMAHVESLIKPTTPTSIRFGRLDTGIKAPYDNRIGREEAGNFLDTPLIRTEWSGIIDEHLGGIW